MSVGDEDSTIDNDYDNDEDSAAQFDVVVLVVVDVGGSPFLLGLPTKQSSQTRHPVAWSGDRARTGRHRRLLEDRAQVNRPCSAGLSAYLPPSRPPP